LLIAGVLVIGIAGVVYSRVRQAPDAGAVRTAWEALTRFRNR